MKDLQEKINKYLDGEMSENEKKEFLNEVECSPELKRELTLFSKTHKLFASIPTDNTSIDFTSRLMKRVLTKSRTSNEQKTFLYSVYSIFGIMILGILGYLAYQIIGAHSGETQSLFSAKEIANQVGNYFSTLFGKQGLSIIGSILALSLLVASYLLYDQKRITRT